MENPSTTFSNMNTEFLIDAIMSRLDGPTLAASACACPDLRVASSDQNLWKTLCSATWPSTKPLLTSSFDKFYADAFPLILCQSRQNTFNPTVANASCSDLVSLVDIYYKGKCILSKVIDAIPEPTINDVDNDKDGDELLQWLLECPFRLDVLPYSDEHNTNFDDNELTSGVNDDCMMYFPSLASLDEKGKGGPDKRDEIEEDIRLSWILFDKKSRRSVNLSSWKPMLVKKSWAPDGEYILHFGSIVPIDTCTFAECKIEARFQMIQNSGYAKWTEISMRLEDMAGAHLGTTKSLGVFNQALYSKRTTKHLEVEKANNEYKMHKKEMKTRHDRHEYLVDKFYTLVGLTILTTISYGCTTLFH